MADCFKDLFKRQISIRGVILKTQKKGVNVNIFTKLFAIVTLYMRNRDCSNRISSVHYYLLMLVRPEQFIVGFQFPLATIVTRTSRSVNQPFLHSFQPGYAFVSVSYDLKQNFISNLTNLDYDTEEQLQQFKNGSEYATLSYTSYDPAIRVITVPK